MLHYPAERWKVGGRSHPSAVAPGLARGPACILFRRMDRERRGGWVYIMADRYRGTMSVEVTSHLAQRVFQHRSGDGSDFCRRYGLNRLVWAERGAAIGDCIANEKSVKRWRREWKFDLVEQAHSYWLYP